MRRLSSILLFSMAVLTFTVCVSQAKAQTYLNTVGDPSFGVNVPVPNGYINIGNGNLHLEFPLATLKQRGDLKLNERLVYDSRIWDIVHYSGYYWWPLNIPNAQLGWRYVQGNETGTLGVSASQIQDTSCWNGTYNDPYTITTTYYSWTDPQGTVHPFSAYLTSEDVPYGCQGVQGGPAASGYSGYATDASGYFATVTTDAYGNANVTVKDNSGTQVYPQVIDRYGNYWSSDGNQNLIDDLGRTPVIQTVNGNVTYYDVLAPNGPIQNNGTRVRYTVTYAYYPISTAFNQPGVVEYQNNGGNPPLSKLAIQSIQLPDGSSYQFTYDTYGEIQSETLPTGGVVNFGWSNYTDSYSNVNRWITSSTINNATTYYNPAVISTCNSLSTGCQESVTLQRPSGDATLYALTLDNGAWDVNTTIYQGGVAANQPKLASVDGYNFTQPCTIPGCAGAQNIYKSSEINTLPDANIATQVLSNYKYPETGQMTSWSQSDYYTVGSTPSGIRSIQYTYNGFDLIEEAHQDQNGTTVSDTKYNYNSSATATSGIVNHGTANAGGPYLTSVVKTNNTPNSNSSVSSSVTLTRTYDDTGAVLSSTDPNGNPPTTYKYDPTDTFVVETDKPNTSVAHVTRTQYDPNSGAVLRTDDENSVANGQAYSVRYSYESVGGRVSLIQYPDGGSTQYAYPSATEVDKTIAQNSTTSLTTQSIKDAYGRNYQTIAGGISSEIGYDGNGRKDSVTTKHLSSASPTDGVTYTSYDTLDRVSTITNPDGSKKSFAYIGKVLTESDEMYNQKQETFDAFNEVSAVTESDPTSGALDLTTVYQRDGLGNIICVEQHGNTSGAGCSSPQSSDPSSAWRVRRFFYNSLGQMVASEIPEHMSLPSKPPSQSCGLSSGNVWTDCYVYDSDGNLKVATDNSGATTNYIYDALSRVTSQTSSSLQNAYTYDAGGGSNGIGLLASQASQHSQSTFSYDVMERTLSESSCRNSGCTSSVFYKTQAGYDLAGNVTSVIYPDGRMIQNGYDTLNRPTSVVYHQWQYPTGPTVGTTYWSSGSYAPPGQLTAATYGNGMQMQAGFTNRQAISSLSYQANNSAIFNKTYQWDKNATNLLLETNNISGQYRQFGYDRLNRLKSGEDMQAPSAQATGTASISGTDGYTQNCRRTSCINVYDRGTVTITINGYTVSTSYTGSSTSDTIASALMTLLNNSGSPVTAVLSDPNTIQMTSAASGSAADYAISATSISTTGVVDFPVSLSGGTLTGGVTGTPASGGLNQQYTYDAWGDLTQMGGTSGFSQPSNSQNQVAAYSYDAAGRLLSDGFHSYTYDSNGMLLTSSDGATYTYDGKEQRSSVTSGGAESDYYYFGGRLFAINSPSGWTDLIYAGSQRIATVAGTQTAAPVYDVVDHAGSEVATVNGGTGAQSSLDYTPYGQVLNGTNSDGFVFTGLQRDPDGLDHADMRQYTSTAGRWITSDPYSGSYDIENPQSLNRYAYVNNNPLGFIDPSGEAGGVIGWGSVCGIGNKIDGNAFQQFGGFNPCNPIVSIISAVVVQTGLANALGMVPAGSANMTAANIAVKQMAAVGAVVNAAFTIACSIDNFNSAMCGPSGWTSIAFGNNSIVGKVVNDSIAATGAALCVAAAMGGLGAAPCVGYAIYSIANAVFSWIWSDFSGPQFTGSLLPRPAARGGLGSSATGIPDKNLSRQEILGQPSTGAIPTPAP